MKWILKCKNIIDEPADVLVCSANVSLNLSGGVGAELLGRYGMTMQKTLYEILSSRNKRYVQQGEIIPYSDPSLPYKAVLHAVAVNGFYESSPLIIEDIVRKSLHVAHDYEAKSVALTALATGYGNLSLSEFA